MQAFIFYLIYPLLWLIASLPFSLLYKVSDVFYHIIRFTGYRQKVVLQNLRNSFPEKTEAELEALSKEFYRYLCDLVFETLKTMKMTERQAREHCIFHNTEWLRQLQQQNQSILIVMGHYGNWEWAGPSFTLNTGFQLVVIYRPLSNPYFERMMTRMRTKFGTKITPVNQTLRDMVANRSQLTATAFIADQNATPKDAYWTDFMHQDTGVFTGPEKLATRFNYPVVYMNVKRVKRGYYEITPELLCAEPKHTAAGDISEAFTRRLEKEIMQDAPTWLWSHRRWKHKRPALYEPILA